MGTRARTPKTNLINLTKNDYKGAPSTLCQGCGHNSIASQIVQVAYELNIKPHELIKTSGIGCSSKSPTYFLGMSHGFNSLHGRMPSVSTGALIANHHLKAIGVSGDGDTASIGFGQFKHALRRNVRMVYIIENNGVYGLTKGQFSATADEGAMLKYAGRNELPPIDICMEAIMAGAGFVARSFSGDAKQVRELLKAALSHRGTAVLDIISPCVAFNNEDTSSKSYGYGREHEAPLHDFGWVPPAEEIKIDPQTPGDVRGIQLHDGSHIKLRRLADDYDPTDKMEALRVLQHTDDTEVFITGLIYFDPSRESLAEASDLTDVPLAHLPDEMIRPSKEALDALMAKLM